MKYLGCIGLGLSLLAPSLAIGSSVAVGQTDNTKQQPKNEASP